MDSPPSAEDAHSVAKMVLWMQAHAKDREDRQNAVGVDLRMDKTFAERRRQIVEDNISIPEVLATFPFLGRGDQVQKFFCLVVGLLLFLREDFTLRSVH